MFDRNNNGLYIGLKSHLNEHPGILLLHLMTWMTLSMLRKTFLIVYLHCPWREKREFFKSAFKENKNNVGAIWKTIKTLTGTKKGTTQNVKKLIVDGRVVDNTEEVAEQFNCYFCSIADKLRLSLSYVPLDLSKLNDFVQFGKDPGIRSPTKALVLARSVLAFCALLPRILHRVLQE